MCWQSVPSFQPRCALQGREEVQGTMQTCSVARTGWNHQGSFLDVHRQDLWSLLSGFQMSLAPAMEEPRAPLPSHKIRYF